MGAAEGKKQKISANGGNAHAVARKMKRRKTDIGKTRDGSKETHQVASALVCAKSDSTFTQTLSKKKRRLKVVQEYGRNSDIMADEASSEEEKQSLLAWVELCMEPLHNGDSIHNSHGHISNGYCVKGKSSYMQTQSPPACSGKDANGALSKQDASSALKNGAFDQIPVGHGLNFDEEGCLACVKKESSNGIISQANSFAEGFSEEVRCMQCSHEGPMQACLISKHANGSTLEMGISHRQLCKVANGASRVPNGEIHTFAPAHHKKSVNDYVARAKHGHQRGMNSRYAIESVEADTPCHGLNLRYSEMSSLRKEKDPLSVPSSAKLHDNKRKREDKVLQYVLKRNIVLHRSPLEKPSAKKQRTSKTVVLAWGRNIPVTLTSEACTVQEWISSQSGSLFGLDVEWRPNRAKGEKNKVALLQLCNESECLIIQMLFLDRKPQALHELLSDPSKSLAGVGVLADGKRLLRDYGLEFQGGIELTALAVDRLKRDELRNVGLKVLVQEVLGLKMDKPKQVTLSNWAKVKLDPAQISYACMDAWASFALSRKLLEDL